MSRERPKTATLPHPSILDETLKDKVKQQIDNILIIPILHCICSRWT